MKPVTPGHRILIKPRTLADTDKVFAAAVAAGLKLMDQTERQEASVIDIGTVLQIGPTAFNDFGGADKWCKVGDLVSYTRYGGKVLSDPDDPETKYLVCNDEDVLMVWEAL